MGKIPYNSSFKDGLVYRSVHYSGPRDLYQRVQPPPNVPIETCHGRLRRLRVKYGLNDELISQALYLHPDQYRSIYGKRKTWIEIDGATLILEDFYAENAEESKVTYRNFWQRVKRLKKDLVLTKEKLRQALVLEESDWISFYGGGRRREFIYEGEEYPEFYGRSFRSVSSFLKQIGRYGERATIWSRLKAGWSFDLALSVPVDHPTERKGLVYKITRVSTGQVYVGITLSSLEQRWTFHKINAKSGNARLACAIREDGEDGFLLEVLEDQIEKPELLKEREKYWVGQLNSRGATGLNVAAPGSLSIKPGKPIEVDGKQYPSLKEASEVEGARRGLPAYVVLKRLVKGEPIPTRARRHSKHLEAGSNLFRRWLALKKRHPQMVDSSWFESYDQFKADVGLPVNPELQLVRIDDSKPWGPKNFEWVTVQEKMDRLSGISLVVDGNCFPTLVALAKHYGIGVSTLKYRIKNQGMTPEAAVRKPLSETSFRNSEGKVVVDGKAFRSKRQTIAYVRETQGLTEYKAMLLVNDLVAKEKAKKSGEEG